MIEAVILRKNPTYLFYVMVKKDEFYLIKNGFDKFSFSFFCSLHTLYSPGQKLRLLDCLFDLAKLFVEF